MLKMTIGILEKWYALATGILHRVKASFCPLCLVCFLFLFILFFQQELFISFTSFYSTTFLLNFMHYWKPLSSSTGFGKHDHNKLFSNVNILALKNGSIVNSHAYEIAVWSNCIFWQLWISEFNSYSFLLERRNMYCYFVLGSVVVKLSHSSSSLNRITWQEKS